MWTARCGFRVWPMYCKLFSRCIQADHFGKLALPVAEFLSLTHNTAYAGYAASGPDSLDQIQEEPFFATVPSGSSPPTSSPRKSNLARKSPSSPGKHSRSPRKAGTAQQAPAKLDRINTGIHDAVMHPITCTPSATLKEASLPIIVVKIICPSCMCELLC